MRRRLGAAYFAAALASVRPTSCWCSASAIVDRRDVIPRRSSGGRADRPFRHAGRPRHLLLLGHVGEVPVLVCRLRALAQGHGFDWVLQRLCAGVQSDGARSCGYGGRRALAEIPTRGLPRAEAGPAPDPKAPETKTAPGPRHRRAACWRPASRGAWGRTNCSPEIDGRPMVARTAAAPAVVARAADYRGARHQADEVDAALLAAAGRAGAQPVLCRGAVDVVEARPRDVACRTRTASNRLPRRHGRW